MRVAVSGARGFVGQALVRHLTRLGFAVKSLVRHSPSRSDEIYWDPQKGEIDRDGLEKMDAVIHLAGENIAAKRWSKARKKEIVDSRIVGTKLLAGTLASLQNPPKVFISVSATGFYGNRSEEMTEESLPGTGFLPETCQSWEAASQEAAKAPKGRAGIRVVNPRLGMVLGRRGGALAKMLPPFRLGLGAVFGDGKQPVSWIHLEDLLRIFEYLLHNPLSGPVNAVAPHAVSNRELTEMLARVLKRPAWFRMPAFAVRLIFGEMGEKLLLQGANVVPEKLIQAGFRFRFSDLEGALRHELM